MIYIKKGFTIIELIISIALILVLGTTTTVVVLKTNKNNDLDKITKEVLESANAYFKVEKDSNGKSFSNEILSGSKGVRIPVSNLVQKGYLDETTQNKLYELNEKLENNKDYYVMFIEDNQACGEGKITSLASWIEKGNEIYLCSGIKTNDNLVASILENYNESSIEVKGAVTNLDYYEIGYSGYSTRTFISVQSGLFKKEDGTKYYRGIVGNNYVSINNEIFRIMSFTNDEIKLIKEKIINENYFMNADGVCYDSNTYTTVEYKNSKFHNSLKLWYADFIEDFNNNTGKNTDLLFKNFNYCAKAVNTDECLGDIVNEKYSLPNFKDLIYAGIPRITTQSDTCNSFNKTSCQGAKAAFNWLASGDSTIMMDQYSADFSYEFYGLSNYISKSGEVSYAVYGMVTGIRIDNYLYENKLKYIRPIIVLDNSKITFTGKGTVDSPYIIEPNY